MTDLLVRLYDLPASTKEAGLRASGIVLRRALPPERHVVLGWVARHFSQHWASEVAVGMSQQPPTVYLAVGQERVLGFACYDTTAKGFFGPTGVAETDRGIGIGEALLITALRGMREAGYAHAVIGDPGPVEFYRKRLEVLDITGSDPGFYAGML